MALSFSNLGASAAPDFASATNATSYNTASWTPPPSGLIGVWIVQMRNGGGIAPSGMSGNSLTWTSIAHKALGGTTDASVSLFAANASGSSAGVTTISYAAAAPNCAAAFFLAEGANLSGGVA